MSSSRTPSGDWKRTLSPARALISARASGDTQLMRPRPTSASSTPTMVRALIKEADAPVDFAQAALAVDVVAVFRAIAIGSRPRDHFDHLGSLTLDQFLKFVPEPGMASRGDVIARSRRELQRRFETFVIVAVDLTDKRLVHQYPMV